MLSIGSISVCWHEGAEFHLKSVFEDNDFIFRYCRLKLSVVQGNRVQAQIKPWRSGFKLYCPSAHREWFEHLSYFHLAHHAFNYGTY